MPVPGTYLNRKIDGKPAKHARRMRLGIDTYHNILIELTFKIPGKAVQKRSFFDVELKSAVRETTPTVKTFC